MTPNKQGLSFLVINVQIDRILKLLSFFTTKFLADSYTNSESRY